MVRTWYNCRYAQCVADHPVDTYSDLTLVGSSDSYHWSQTGIAWPGEANKYAEKPGYDIDDIVPPPNWRLRFPDGYTNSTPPPNLKVDEHFQNWMRTAGLPTFTKLWGRNDGDKLTKGRYQIVVDLSERKSRLVIRLPYSDILYRLSRTDLSWYEINRHFYSLLDRWQEPVFGLGLCGVSCIIRGASSVRCNSPFDQAEVCVIPFLLIITDFLPLRKLGDMSLLSWNH